MAPWAAGLLFALPILIAKYPPMADLPLHEATVGLLRHWGDKVFAPPSLYFVNLGHANQLFTLVVLAFSYVVPITWASKLAVAATLVALPVAAAHFAESIRAPRVTALLVAPLGLGWLFFWGLIQNLVGLAAFLATLPAIDRFAARPTWRGVWRICGVILLLHFAHQAMLVIACLGLFLCSLGSGRPLKDWALRFVPMAFGVLLVIVENIYAWHLAGPRHLRSDPVLFYGLWHKLSGLSGVLFGGYERYVRNAMMILALVPVGLFVAYRLRHRAKGKHDEPFLRRWRFEALVAALLLAYLLAPVTIKSTTLFYHRFLPPAWALLAVCAGAGVVGSEARLARWLCGVLPIASILIAWPTFADSDRVYTDLERVTKDMQPGAAVVALNLDPQPPHRLWNPTVVAGHLVALHGGRALYDYTQSPMSIVAQRPDRQWAEPCDRLDGASAYDLRPDWDFTRFRYVLLITPRPTLATGVRIALQKQARLVANEGSWYLFESILPLVAIDADDAPVPRPKPPTLRRELQLVADDLLKEIEEDPATAQAVLPADAREPLARSARDVAP